MFIILCWSDYPSQLLKQLPQPQENTKTRNNLLVLNSFHFSPSLQVTATKGHKAVRFKTKCPTVCSHCHSLAPALDLSCIPLRLSIGTKPGSLIEKALWILLESIRRKQPQAPEDSEGGSAGEGDRLRKRFQTLSSCLPKTLHTSTDILQISFPPLPPQNPNTLPLPITVSQILTDLSQTLMSAIVKESKCFRQQNLMPLPCLCSLGLDMAKGKITRVAKRRGGTGSAEVMLAGVIRHRESTAVAQHAHMDRKGQSHPMALAFPHTTSSSQVPALGSQLFVSSS